MHSLCRSYARIPSFPFTEVSLSATTRRPSQLDTRGHGRADLEITDEQRRPYAWPKASMRKANIADQTIDTIRPDPASGVFILSLSYSKFEATECICYESRWLFHTGFTADVRA